MTGPSAVMATVVLKVGGQLAVLGDDGPAVLQGPDVAGALIDHGLDGDGHARKQPGAASGSTEIGNTGVFVQVRAYLWPTNCRTTE